MPVLSLACHLPHNTPSRYNNEQTTKQTKAINNSYIYIYISCKCDTNRAGHFTLDAYASRPVACWLTVYVHQYIQWFHITLCWRHCIIQNGQGDLMAHKANCCNPIQKYSSPNLSAVHTQQEICFHRSQIKISHKKWVYQTWTETNFDWDARICP